MGVVSGPSRRRTACDVVARIVESNPTIETLSLVSYVEGPNWRDLQNARDADNLPFLLRGLGQDRGERISMEIPRNDASPERLAKIAWSLPDNRVLGIISRVGLPHGRSAHIPMMDFICTVSAANQDVLIHLLKEFRRERGWLLESGRSYHYYGSTLLSEAEWPVFLGKCLLMSGQSDDRYIGHQLVDGHCVLRLSAGKLKVQIPTVVAELG